MKSCLLWNVNRLLTIMIMKQQVDLSSLSSLSVYFAQVALYPEERLDVSELWCALGWRPQHSCEQPPRRGGRGGRGGGADPETRPLPLRLSQVQAEHAARGAGQAGRGRTDTQIPVDTISGEGCTLGRIISTGRKQVTWQSQNSTQLSWCCYVSSLI